MCCVGAGAVLELVLVLVPLMVLVMVHHPQVMASMVAQQAAAFQRQQMLYQLQLTNPQAYQVVLHSILYKMILLTYPP